MRCAWLLLPLSVLLSACEPPPRAIRIELIPSTSCGRSYKGYDITCVAAVEIKVIDSNGGVVGSKCTAINGRYSTIDDIIGGDFLPVLEDIKARPSSRIELRAYHAFDKIACTDQTFDELMMWGSSDLVDFTDPEVQVVNLRFECRPFCDCFQQDADSTACPSVLEPGVCTPNSDVFACRGSCSTSADCLIPGLACTGQECAANAGAICADCGGRVDCDGGACVHNIKKDESFCTIGCPIFDNVDACPGLMSCRRVDGSVFQELP